MPVSPLEAHTASEAVCGTGTWAAGSYTPARCLIWNHMNDLGRAWLTNLLAVEKTNGKTYPTDVPPLEMLKDEYFKRDEG